ncbi:cytochrome P450 family protein [Nocardioides terrisoli]|uniref:hypothetical protein n=1 Tax=Nocardioides terrisoli TaxID=3388267 RepID=UPI00287B63CB|nr:hypothetical protein [Nocardioides marmorisolisilvae]
MSTRDAPGLRLVRHGYPTIPAGREQIERTATAATLRTRPLARPALVGDALDGSDHRHRTAMFLDVLDGDAVAGLRERARRELLDLTGRRWAEGETRGAFDLLVEAYGIAALDWAGIDLGRADAIRLSHRLAAIVDGFGLAGTADPRAWSARWRMNRWGRGQVRRARRHPEKVPAGPLRAIAAATDRDGAPLDQTVAAIELLNVLRPAVAAAYLGAFALLALHQHPHWQDRLAPAEASELRTSFAHEVRRTAPPVPALAGRLVDHGRRCPGEPTTVALLEATLEVFSGLAWHAVGEGHDPAPIPARERLRLVQA